MVIYIHAYIYIYTERTLSMFNHTHCNLTNDSYIEKKTTDMLIVPHFATFLKLCRVLHIETHHVICPVVCVSNHQVSLPVRLASLYTALASMPLFSSPVWFDSLCVDWRNNVCSGFWVCCNAFRAQVDGALIQQFWRSTGAHWQSLAQPSGWQLVTT